MSAWHFCYGQAREQPKSNALTPGGEYPVAACDYLSWYADSKPQWGQDLLTVTSRPGKVRGKCVNR